ncbi:TPA: hypothetical protein OXC89_004213 [Citrobacter freundii]|nr:hypothetical protein [Citrobacter freundii]HCW3406304.1 hypothetical protein [Citrobacter freundii]
MTEKTLAALLCERVTEFANSPKAVEMIDKGIESMFKGVVDDCFGRYDGMSKLVKESVKAALPGDISNLFELKRYNAIIAESMKHQWESVGLEDDMKARLGTLLDETLKEHDLPPVILLSDFMEAFMDAHHEEAFENGWEAPKVIYKESNHVQGFHHLFFDKNPGESSSSHTRSEYDLQYRIAISTRDGEVFRTKDHWQGDIDIPLGQVYSAVLDGKPARKEISPNRFERMVQALYYGMSKIAIDCDPEDICYPCHD